MGVSQGMCYHRLLLLVLCSYEEKLTAEKQKQVVSKKGIIERKMKLESHD